MSDPAVSFVCVSNDPAVLDARLRAGVARQKLPCELIVIDNRDGQFRSAAAALNRGAAQARGEWLVFAHQDVEPLSATWANRLLEFAPEAGEGWCGVAGRTGSGASAGFLLDRGVLVCTTGRKPEPVQTLDECVLIHRRKAGGPYFDEGVPGWHAYGVEACLRAAREGRRNAVLMLPTWHDSKAVNIAGLDESHRYVWEKHRDAFPVIYTTVGNLGRIPGPSPVRRVWKHLARRLARLIGFRSRYVHGFEAALDAAATEPSEPITVLHAASDIEPITAQGLNWNRPRPVLHRFDGPMHLSTSSIGDDHRSPHAPRGDFPTRSVGSTIVMPELTAEHLRAGNDLAAMIGPPRSIVGVFASDLLRQARSWRRLRQRLNGEAIFTTRRNDDTQPVILLTVEA